MNGILTHSGEVEGFKTLLSVRMHRSRLVIARSQSSMISKDKLNLLRRELMRLRVNPCTVLLTFYFLIVFSLVHVAPIQAAAATLPGNLVNDPVTKLVGPEVMSAAVKEGRIVWYAGDNTGEFFNKGGKEAFEKRFGIKMEPVVGR